MKKSLVLLSACFMACFAHAALEGYFMLAIFSPGELPLPLTHITGARASLIYGECQDFDGLDVGMVGRVREHMNGLQVGASHLVGTDGNGAQVGLAYNWCGGDWNGFQCALWNDGDAGRTRGFQLGAYNFAAQFSGFQLGFVNWSEAMTGFQLGLVNVSEALDGLQVGLVNFEKVTLPAKGDGPVEEEWTCWPFVNWEF